MAYPDNPEVASSNSFQIYGEEGVHTLSSIKDTRTLAQHKARLHSKHSSFCQSVSIYDYYINCHLVDGLVEEDGARDGLAALGGRAEQNLAVVAPVFFRVLRPTL